MNMLHKMSSQRAMLVVIVCLLVYILAQKQCNSVDAKIIKEPKTTVIKDTVYQTKVDTFYLQTEKYKTVYVPRTVVESTAEIEKKEKEEISKEELPLFEEAREYRDTLLNDGVEIYSYNLLKGELLKSSLSYKLKVPREIKTTTTIEHPATYRSGLYGFGEVGGNQEQFSNISLGLQYNRKGNWFVSYRVNIAELTSVTHNVGVGIRIQ